MKTMKRPYEKIELRVLKLQHHQKLLAGSGVRDENDPDNDYQIDPTAFNKAVAEMNRFYKK